jgi:AraC-like DNA-binding protein
MLILNSDSMLVCQTTFPASPLNALWSGVFEQSFLLPQIGHLFFVFPLAGTSVGCADVTIDSDHYLMLTEMTAERPYLIENLCSEPHPARMLLLCLSPGFIVDIAQFLQIPADLNQLLHGIPLLRGDMLSQLLDYLAAIAMNEPDPDELDDLFFEVVGQVLQLMRLRHQALLSLAPHKRDTIDDLLPRLLQARQFIEAQFLQPIKTSDAADHVAISEYHFARLFKAAFEVTVHQYVMRLRLNASRHLLEQPESSVTNVALLVGYNSMSAFINAFRRQFGVSPSRYRARFMS